MVFNRMWKKYWSVKLSAIAPRQVVLQRLLHRGYIQFKNHVFSVLMQSISLLLDIVR